MSSRADRTETFEAWVADLSARPALTAGGRSVLATLRTQPQLSAFASARKLAGAVGVNVGTVTRTAQALGYEGWPSLQYELRSRYVASLSAVQVSTAHELEGSTAASSLQRDIDALGFTQKSVSPESISGVAQAIAAARRTVVLAPGSFAAPGVALAHNASLAGYDVRHEADVAASVNSLSRLSHGDLLVTINCWHIWRSSVLALEVAQAAGVDTVLITDSTSSLLSMECTHRLVVPAEGAGFFPSLVATIALCQAVVVELAQVDPEHSRQSVAAAEAEWERFELLRARNA